MAIETIQISRLQVASFNLQRARARKAIIQEEKVNEDK
jgi:hypothetical protein